MDPLPATSNAIWFVYDGECPLCQFGASFYRLRQSVGSLHTIDARSEHDHPVMQEINRAGLDVDQGMVIKYQDRLYQGRDALHLMAQLGATDECLANLVNNTLFRSKGLATLCYPFMKAGRNLALAIKGVGRIDNLRHTGKDG